jgi:site-specific recombinase XerD
MRRAPRRYPLNQSENCSITSTMVSLAHAVRHTYATLLINAGATLLINAGATLLINAGASLPEVQRLLGHADLPTT